MKTLSEFNQTAVDSPYIDVIRLATIDFGGLTLYLCDRVFGDPGAECVFNGQIYEPVIIRWDTVKCGAVNEVTYETTPSTAGFTVMNNVPLGGADTFTGLFLTYDIHYAAVTISEIFEGASAAGDEIVIFEGKVEDTVNMSRSEVTLSCTAFELDISKKFSHEICEADTYSGADPDDISKMFPQVYGSAKKVPFLAVDVGAVTTLAEDIDEDDTTVKTSDSSRLPSSGTIQISNEKITYTGKSGDNLTGCTRGASSTTAVRHNRGSMIGEIKSGYVYALGHAVKAVNDVYVKNVKQESSEYTAYTGQSGDEHGSYAGRAVIEFNEWPLLKREVDLYGTYTSYTAYREAATGTNIGRHKQLTRAGGMLDYDDTTIITFPTAPTGNLSDIYVEYSFDFEAIGTAIHDRMDFYLDGTLIATYDDETFTQRVTSPLKVSKSSWPVSATKTKSWRSADSKGIAFIVRSARVYFESDETDLTARGKQVSRDATNVPLGGASSAAVCETGASITFPAAPTGNLTEIMISVTWEYALQGAPIITGAPHYMAIDGINVLRIDEDGNTTQLMPSTFSIKKSAWQTSISKTASRLDTFDRGELFEITSAVQTCYTDDYNVDVVISGNSMADAIIGGLVAADVDGFQDDGSGTYTGTPNALIERPDHIIKHILIDRCGLSSDEIDSTSYTAAGAYYAANSYTMAFAVLQKPNPRNLISRIAYQARSMEFWEAGTHHLVHIPATETTDRTIDQHRMDLNQVWIKYTSRADILNTMSARYARDWSGYDDHNEADRAVVTAVDAASVAKYGTLEGDQYAFNYIRGETMAQAILDWIKGDMANPRLIVEFAGGYSLTDIERGDIIQFEEAEFEEAEVAPEDMDSGRLEKEDGGFILMEDGYDLLWEKPPGDLEKILLGLVDLGTDQFRVIDMTRRPDFAIQVTAVRI